MKQNTVQWLGNDGFLLSDGETIILTDPDLFNAERIWQVSDETLSRCLSADFVCYTHAHEDHFSTQTAQWLLNNSRCRFVIPKSCQTKAEQIEGMCERAVFVQPGQHGQIGTIGYETVRAVHGHKQGTVYSGADLRDCGYVFLMNGKRIYQPGDTLLLEEHMEMAPVDVLFVSPTEHNTYVEHSLQLIEWLSPKTIVCQHFGTYEEPPINFFWAHGYVRELRDALPQQQKESCIIPAPEEMYLI